MDSLQASLDTEIVAKLEALRMKKKLESEINDMEIALDHANKANAEAHKSIKRYQGQLREVEKAIETESREHQEIAEKLGLTERKCVALQADLDDHQALLDTAERAARDQCYKTCYCRRNLLTRCFYSC